MRYILIAITLGSVCLGMVILVAVHRSPRLRGQLRNLVLAGSACAVMTTCWAFSRSTVPIHPYEEGSALDVLLGLLPVFLPIGFGLGVLLGALVLIPAALLIERRRSRRSDPPSR